MKQQYNKNDKTESSNSNKPLYNDKLFKGESDDDGDDMDVFAPSRTAKSSKLLRRIPKQYASPLNQINNNQKQN